MEAPVGLSLASVILQVLRKRRTEEPQQPFVTLLRVCKDYSLLFCLGKAAMHIPDYHSLQKNVLAVLPASCHSTCRMYPLRSHETVSVQCILKFPHLILFQQAFLALDFPRLLRVLEFLKTGLTSKELGRKGTDYLSLFHTLCHQVPHPIQQQSTFSLLLGWTVLEHGGGDP